jgi:hypothetical protein
MTIPGLVLHVDASSKLDELLKNPAHAMVLAGDAGSGKTHIVRGLATALLQVTSLENAAYYREIAPKNSSITIEQVRALAEFFRLKVPGTTKIARIAVLQDADTMSTEAQNALLKLLEEPPLRSVIILTSSRPKQLLRTIRSRVQLVYLPSPDPQTLQEHFTVAGYDKTAISSAILRAGGDVAEIERILKAETPDDTVSLVKQALSGSPYDRLLMVESIAKQKDKGLSFVTTLTAVATASLHAAATKNAPSLERWKNIVQTVHITEDAYARNGNAKLVLTELMLAL